MHDLAQSEDEAQCSQVENTSSRYCDYFANDWFLWRRYYEEMDVVDLEDGGHDESDDGIGVDDSISHVLARANVRDK